MKMETSQSGGALAPTAPKPMSDPNTLLVFLKNISHFCFC